MQLRKMFVQVTALVMVVSGVVSTASAQQDYSVWVWDAGTGYWNNSSNWKLKSGSSGNPYYFDQFTESQYGDVTVHSNATSYQLGLVFGGSTNYTIDGSHVQYLQPSSGTDDNGYGPGTVVIDVKGTGRDSFGAPLAVLSPSQNFMISQNNTNNPFTISGTIDGGNVVGGMTVTGPGNTIISGAISNTSLWVTGTGMLTLSGTNTYTGGMTIQGGTLNINSDVALGATPASPVTNVVFASGIGNSTLQVGAPTVSLSANRNISILSGAIATIDTQSNAMTIPGAVSGSGGLTKIGTGTLTLNGSNSYTGLTHVQQGVLSVGVNNDMNGDLQVDAGAVFQSADGCGQTVGNLSGAGSITLNNQLLWVSSGNYSGSYSGTGSLVKQGNGVLTLSGTNAYTGATTVNSGTLRLSSPNLPVSALGNSSQLTINSGGTVDVASTNATGYAAAIPITINTGGLMTSENNVTSHLVLGTTLTLSGGTLASGTPDPTWGSWNLDGDVMVNGSNTSTISATNVLLSKSGGVTFNVAGGATLNVSGNFANVNGYGYSNALVKAGSGTMVLSGTNTNTGGTTMQGGTLNINSDAALGTAPASPATNVTFSGNSTLQAGAAVSLSGNRNITINSGITATLDTQSNTMSIPGVVNGSGGLTKIGSGTLTLSGANTYSGGTTVNAGVLALGNNTALGAANSLLTVTSGGTVNLSGFNPTVNGLSDSGMLGGTSTASVWSNNASNLTITPSSSNSHYGGTISGPVGVTVNTGAGGVQILSGNNTYTGGTTVNGGRLEAWSANALGTAGALVTVANGGNLSLKGLTDNINYAQNLTVNGNSGLNINTDATLQHATWSGNITLNSGATLGVGGGWSGSGVLNISGRVSGGGALNVVNPDTVILSGNSNTYTGKTTVSSGTLTAGAANALSANSDMTVNGGTLDVSGYATTVKSLTLSSGTLDLGTGNVMTAGGAANFNGGTIALSGSATLGKYTLARASSAIGTVSSATSGVPAYYHVSANGSELDLTHYATVGSIFATPSSTQIIVGGSTPVSVTVGNSAPVNSDNLSFSVTPGGNMSGSGSGTAAAGGNSGPVSGLSFTGSTVGAGQTGYFTVSDPNATNNLQPGSVSVDVFDHSNASLSATSNQTSQTIDFGNVLKGATVPTQSFSVYNRAANTTAAYTANLKLTGSTASGDASLNAAVSPFGGLSAGGYVTYTASLNTSNYTTTGTKTVSMSASQLTDDSNLSGAGNNNNGAMNIVLQGNVGNATADNSNSPSTFGSALTAGVAKGGTYANLESTVRATSGNGGAGMLGSTAKILDGTASAATAVSMAWRTRTTAETTRAGGGLISDVVSLSGIAPNGTGLHDGIRQTDMFVLQMSYDPSELFRLWGLTEAQAVAQNDLQLKYLDPGTDGLIGISNDSWTGAVDGNFGGTPNYVGDHAYDSSYFVLGDYGVDTTNHVVWAVVDYSGVFAVPEPSSCILLGIGAVSLLAWGWRRLRAA